MKIIKLYTGDDNKSYFMEFDCGHETEQPIGHYSQRYPATSLMFRDFEAGLFYDWHNAPQPQYIIYLEGEVEVHASGGETKIFKPGDVLFATDITGTGHTTKSLAQGKSIVVTTE